MRVAAGDLVDVIGRLRFGHGLPNLCAFKNTKNTKTTSHDDGILEFAPGMNRKGFLIRSVAAYPPIQAEFP
jgi:hypothetical protein